MKIIDLALIAVTLGLTTSYCDVAAARRPDESRMLAALQKAHPGTRFTAIARTPVPDIYEAWMGKNMALISRKNLRYLMFGRVFDTKTMTDLTAPKLADAEGQQDATVKRDNQSAPDAPVMPIDQFPTADTIKSVRGKGQRTVVIFSDPACVYCQRLEAELDQLDNVTIHTFMLPLQGHALPRAIWCSSNRQAAWRQAMAQGDRNTQRGSTSSQSTPDCTNPLERNLALAQRLQVQGTPTIFYADGTRTAGYATAADINARIAAAASPKSSGISKNEETLR